MSSLPNETQNSIKKHISKFLESNPVCAKTEFSLSELQQLSKQMANGIEINSLEIIGLYDASIADSLSGKYSGILFTNNEIFVNLNHSSKSQRMKYDDMIAITGDPTSLVSTLKLISYDDNQIKLKGISYTSSNIFALFSNIIKTVSQANRTEDTSLTEYQSNFIKKYLNSNIFAGKCSDVKNAKKALLEAYNIRQSQANKPGRFICTYGGVFGVGSTIKNVSFFSEDTLYFKNSQEQQAIIVPYDSIQSVTYIDKAKTGSLLYENSKCVSLPKRTIIALKGIEIIRKITPENNHLLGKYILSQEGKIFGEHLTFSMLNLFKYQFPKEDILSWIPRRCTITEVSLERVIIKITVTDKDYDYFSPEEWENAINIFSTRRDVLEKIRDELSVRLCWDYSLDQIVFSSRFRKSISKAISNGVNTVSNVTLSACEHLKTAAYYEAAQNSRLKADIIKDRQGTDNDNYVENMEKYHQYMETYRERTKVQDDEDNNDYLYYED